MSLARFIFLGIFSFSLVGGNAQTYVHIVTDRDNIHKLARIYGVSAAQIAKINKLDSANIRLMEHSILIIPDKTYQADNLSGRMVRTIEHRIEKNESLYTIARKYGITVYDLLLLNPHLDRGLPLLEGEEIRVQVTLNADGQYSRQIVYLNGDLYKFNLIEVKDSAEFELVKQFNATLDQRIAEIYEVLPTDEIFDSFPYPENDKHIMTRLIYHLVKNGADSSIDKTDWMDSLYEEVFYVGSEMVEHDYEAVDQEFVVRAFTTIYKMNLANPKNDFLFGLRAVLYYWMESNQKALIFSDEALTINKKNTSALLVRAAVGQQDKHIPYAKDLYKRVNEMLPNKDFLIYNMASLCYVNQEFTTAIELYSKLLTNPHKLAPEINYRIGHCYILNGDDDNGCEYLRTAERLGYDKASSLRLRNCR